LIVDQKAGTSATLSILLAVVSFFITFTGHPVWGLLAALAAIPLGVVGLVVSASPRVGGGILSIGAIVLAVIAIGVAVLGMIGVILF
jgi:hypothetical protein